MVWKITYQIERYRPGQPPRTDTFQVEIEPDEYILDGVERIWFEQDRDLIFRHACHHASCGSCAFVCNGVEVLPCIVRIDAVTHDGGTLHLEPLYGFNVIGDLVVDMDEFFERMQTAAMPIVGPADPLAAGDTSDYNRFEDCIECGMCVSACPVMAANSGYVGPAALAAVERVRQTTGQLDDEQRALADGRNGLWRCHASFECSAVCPSNVDPARKIMALRKHLTMQRLGALIGQQR
jgi:succinate dehydrogenase / fumarate reductase iron-sulfur subunit